MSTKKLGVTLILVLSFLFNTSIFGQTQNFSICPGTSITLSPLIVGDLYSWTAAPNDPSLAVSNTRTVTVSPNVNTIYTVTAVSTSGSNLVVNGDFSDKVNLGFTSEYIYSTPGASFDQGNYGVSDNPKGFNGVFSPCQDHTGATNRNMLVADGASGQKTSTPPKANVWIQTVNVKPNTTYAFSSWITNIYTGAVSSLKFSINGQPIGEPISSLPNPCNWQQFYVVWHSGNNDTSAKISIAEGTGAAQGNDFAIDDIAFYEVIEKTETINVSITLPPTITGNNSLCLYQTTQLSSSATGGTWSSGNEAVAKIDAFGKVEPVSYGTANIKYKLNNACNTTSTFPLAVEQPIVLDSITGISILTISQQSQLIIKPPGGTWTSFDPNVAEVSTDGIVTGKAVGETSITYTISLPCESISPAFKIKVIAKDDLYVPTAFTPNNDGTNDEFKIYGSLIGALEFSIFNQFGEIVYKSTDLTKGWDGIYKGEKQPAGVYIFTAKIKMIDGKVLLKKGAINLIR